MDRQIIPYDFVLLPAILGYTHGDTDCFREMTPAALLPEFFKQY
jgi:hypothetical protein